MVTRIQVRRGNAEEWGAANPTLSSGEIGIETDSLHLKIGDGYTRYGQLRYINEDDEIYLGEWWARKNTIHQLYEDGQSFEKYCDMFAAKGVKNLSGPEIIARVFNENGGIIGSCGPDVEKDDIVRYIEEFNSVQPVYVKFYLKTVGNPIHAVLYNSAYSSIHGGTSSRRKKVDSQSSDNIASIIKQIMNQETFGNKVVQNYELDSAYKSFRFTDSSRLGSFYQPGIINLEGFDEGQLDYYYLYDKQLKNFVRFNFAQFGSQIIKYRTMFIKPGMISFDGGETSEYKLFVEYSPSREPDGLGDYDDYEWESFGVACLYIYRLDAEFDDFDYTRPENQRYYFFRIGGCGNDRISLNIQNQLFQIGLTEDNPICKPYVEYCTTKNTKKIVMLDREIDCSYPISKTEEDGGDRPFHVRFYANEITDCIRPLKKRNGGQAKFRIGIYNPETNVFSKPTTWMRIYKRIGIADMHMSFIN